MRIRIDASTFYAETHFSYPQRGRTLVATGRVQMRKLIAFFALLAVAVPASGQEHVRGYTRSDGTYVAPHTRSAPNNTTLDNWSTKGNVNPYTGRQGTRDPYPTPTYQPRTYTPPRYNPPVYTPPPAYTPP